MSYHSAPTYHLTVNYFTNVYDQEHLLADEWWRVTLCVTDRRFECYVCIAKNTSLFFMSVFFLPVESSFITQLDNLLTEIVLFVYCISEGFPRRILHIFKGYILFSVNTFLYSSLSLITSFCVFT